MSPTDQEQELDALSAEWSQQLQSPFLARCLVRAFSPAEAVRVGGLYLAPLTFATWLALERAKSPFLIDDFEAMRQPEALATALGILSRGEAFTVAELTRLLAPGEAIAAVRAVRGLIAEATSTALAMRTPGQPAAPGDACGFGTWIVLLTLVARLLGQPPEALLGMRMSQAFALAATTAYLDGRVPRGANYLEREIGSGEEGVLPGGEPEVDGQRGGEADHVGDQHAEGQQGADQALTQAAPEEQRDQPGNNQ